MKTYLETVIQPRIQADGGWVEYVSEETGRLTLAFRGECSKCEVLDRCAGWIAEKIRQDLGQDVAIRTVRKKPYFQDNV